MTAIEIYIAFGNVVVPSGHLCYPRQFKLLSITRTWHTCHSTYILLASNYFNHFVTKRSYQQSTYNNHCITFSTLRSSCFVEGNKHHQLLRLLIGSLDQLHTQVRCLLQYSIDGLHGDH